MLVQGVAEGLVRVVALFVRPREDIERLDPHRARDVLSRRHAQRQAAKEIADGERLRFGRRLAVQWLGFRRVVGEPAER